MTRRQRGEGSVFVRADGRHVGIVNLGVDPEGNRRRKHVYGTSTADVVKQMGALRRQLADRGDLPTADITVAKWLDYWLEDIAAPRLKPGTLTGYKSVVELRLKPTLGRHRLSKLAPQHVREMHKAVEAKQLSSTTALNAHRVLSAALNDAVKWGRVGRNVAALVRAPSKEASTRTGLAVPEVIRVLEVAGTDERIGSTWLAAFLLGIRQGERLGLRWSCVDFTANTVDIAWSLQRVAWAHGCTKPCGKRPASCPDKARPIPRGMAHEILNAGNLVLLRPKTVGSRRTVPMIPELRAALLARWDIVQAERGEYTKDLDLVWCQKTGAPLHPRSDWAAWRHMLDVAGVGPKTLHEARNTTATLLLEGGVDTKVIAEILGHSTVVTTRAYQNVSRVMAAEALGGLADRLQLH